MATDAADTTNTSQLRKFQGLLRELFQFDCADLDFGIYRIMNHKRDVVERFVDEKLPAAVAAELDTGAVSQQDQAAAQLKELAARIREDYGADAIGPDGELAQHVDRERPIFQRYLEARAATSGGTDRAAAEAAVYNHLHTFFSRYYEDGDFISKRRYGRNQRYAIPYNGEEVYLHWANSDQYYVKTEENFRDYDWTAPNGVAVRFRLADANIEQNNVKGDKRFFVPRSRETRYDADARVVTIPFEYRPLNAAESTRYGNRNQQDNIIKEAVCAIPKRLEAHTEAVDALTGEHRRNPSATLRAGSSPSRGKGVAISRLRHHLLRYTRKNDSDFFIHKDLSGFLTRELDFYLKNEVLNIDDLVATGERLAEGRFQQMRLIKSIGGKIIDFLAQIEDFQKRLWEKRKFVTDVQYCVTLANVDAAFHDEIVANDAQWAEWRDLLGVDDSQRNAAFLRDNPTLPLDTAHFDAAFTDRLLASFDDLDGMTDGLLVHSENWQALRLLEEKYRRGVKCIYIDPPYNTDASAILYKNGYKDASWLSLIANSLHVGKALLRDDAIFCSAIDDEESSLLRLVLADQFVKQLGIVVVRSNPAGRKSRGRFTPTHEYAMFFGNAGATPGPLKKTDRELDRYPLSDEGGPYAWNNLIRHGSNDRREDRPHQFYPIYVGKNNRIRVPKMEWDPISQENLVLERPRASETPVYPVRTEQDGTVIQKNWHRGWESIKAMPQSDYRVRRHKGRPINNSIDIDFKIRPDMSALPRTWWDDSRYASANRGAKAIKDLFGSTDFSFAKAPGLVEDCIRASGADKTSHVLDYFAGSGTTAHAVINLNREDGGERKFILVEMGDYFDTVLLPRVKKVTYSPEWKDGKPKRKANEEEASRSPRIVKYMRMESYEDALDGIQFDEKLGRMALEERLGEEYLLKYVLKYETKQSRTLLNVMDLDNPFGYRLRARANGSDRELNANVAETFNYLLGLNVRTRHVYDDNGRRYLVYRGETRESPGREVAVIWRDTRGWSVDDAERDRRFVKEQGLADGADDVYVNAPCIQKGAKPVEPLFHARMFAGVSPLP